MKILNNISRMDDNALSRLFGNAQDLLIKNSQNSDAKLVLDAVEKEWEKRLSEFKFGNYKASTPETGILSSVGYKVGNDGAKPKVRRQRLDHIMSGTLPPVGSPAYMAEWGHKLSLQRYQKLHRVVRVLASSGQTLGNMDKAVSEWEDDLIYLEEHWKKRIE